MDIYNDSRIVMTLDAGGTNFVFNAVQGGKEIFEPHRIKAKGDTLQDVLGKIISGFKDIRGALDEAPVAISFCFPGPADYRKGIIGDLEALVAFDEVARSNEERRTLIENGLRQFEISVADVDGIPRAYLLLNDRFFGHPFIELLYVAADSRRSGIGSRLIEYVERHARGSKLFTSTNRSNAPMRAVLRRLGFEESGIIHNLDPGDPELVFFKPLS